MDSAAVSHGAPIDKGNKSSDSKVSRKYIHDDLAFYVLSKLPIKSLKRFGCVRKSWSILFDDSDFMTLFRNHFISRHGNSHDHRTFLLIRHLELPVTPDYRYHDELHLLENRLKLNLPPPFQEDDGNLSILGSTSVDGIFCVGQNSMNKVRYVLWNPATKESVVIPSSPDELVSQQHPNVFVSHDFHGFGYDKVRKDFKVIQYVSFNRIENYSRQLKLFEIYSLKSNSWRIADIDMSQWYFDNAFTANEVYMDGACHWLVSCNNDKSWLMSFDLSEEVFFTTSMDENLDFYKHLVVLNGSIAIISNHDDDLVYHISILGQLGVKESWIKLLIVPFLPLTRPHTQLELGRWDMFILEKKTMN